MHSMILLVALVVASWDAALAQQNHESPMESPWPTYTDPFAMHESDRLKEMQKSRQYLQGGNDDDRYRYPDFQGGYSRGTLYGEMKDDDRNKKPVAGGCQYVGCGPRPNPTPPGPSSPPDPRGPANSRMDRLMDLRFDGYGR